MGKDVFDALDSFVSDCGFFKFAKTLERLEEMWGKERTTDVLQEGAVQSLRHNYEDLLVVVHQVHDVRQQLIPSSFFAQSD